MAVARYVGKGLPTERSRIRLCSVHDLASANARFMMLQTAERVPFAKQPIIERASGEIVGYSGAAWFQFEGAPRLEFGYRLVPCARGQEYAPEAGLAVLAVAADSFRGELLAMVDPRNVASKGVIGKLGFEFWKLGEIDDGYRVEVYRRTLADAQSERRTADLAHRRSVPAASLEARAQSEACLCQGVVRGRDEGR